MITQGCHAELNRLRQPFYFNLIGFLLEIILIVILSSEWILIPISSFDPKCFLLP